MVYSSYSFVSNMRCPGQVQSAVNPALNNTRFRQMNWLLNTYFNPQAGINPTCTLTVNIPQFYFESETATAAGTYGPATWADVQAAMWSLAGQQLEAFAVVI